MPSKTPTLKAASVIACLAGAANAFFRMPCGGRVVLERADPIINPGEVSGHVHTISGGNGFGFSMDYQQARESTCSSCPIKADLSNYWTPKLYFQYANGSFEDVPQAGEGGGNTGGMNVYYLQRGPEPTKLKAFPEGFRMVAGNPFQRNFTDLEEAPGRAVSYNCLGTSNPQTYSLPDYNCPDGLRAQVFFPSCWDGTNLDSDDHKSHMAYPIGGSYDNGKCPSSHPVQLVSLFFEVIYSVDSFADSWPSDKNPFVFAQGDKTGFGFHGDFVNGWDVDTLQDAVTNCQDDSGNISDCPTFDNALFTADQMQACRIPPSVDGDQTTGIMEKLAGCNPVTGNGTMAIPSTDCPFTPIGQAQTFFTDVTKTLDYAYVGCATDDYYERTFTGASTSADNMTVKYCVDYCKSKGYSLAGLEWSRECYCDNDYSDASRAPQTGIMGGCTDTCSGDSTEYCGGSGALSVYKRCGSGQCSNALYTVVGNGSTTDSSGSEKRKRHLGQHRPARLHRES